MTPDLQAWEVDNNPRTEEKLIDSIKYYTKNLKTPIEERETASSDTQDRERLRKSPLALLEALSNMKVM